MNRRSSVDGVCLLLWCCVAPASGGTVQAVGETAKNASGTTRASCIVRVSFSERSDLINGDILNIVLHSMGVADAAAKEVFDRPYGELEPFIPISFEEKGSLEIGRGRWAIVGKLSVAMNVDPIERAGEGAGDGRATPSELPRAAREFLTSICARLGTALASAHEASLLPPRERAAAAAQRVAFLRKDVDAAQQALNELRKEAGFRELWRDDLQNRLNEIEQQAQEVELKRMIQAARREAIEEQIARIGADVRAGLGGDDISRELDTIVGIREQAVERARALVQQTSASQNEMNEALERLAQAKVELYRHRREMSQRMGGEMLADLNNQLRQLVIQAAELETRSRFLARRREGAVARLGRADEFERRADRLDDLRRELERALGLQNELKERLETVQPPAVVVVGGAGGPTP